MAKHNVTTKELVRLYHEIDPTSEVTEYVIEKSRLTQKQKNQTAKQIQELLDELSTLPKETAEIMKRMAKEAVNEAKQQEPLWPSLCWD